MIINHQRSNPHTYSPSTVGKLARQQSPITLASLLNVRPPISQRQVPMPLENSSRPARPTTQALHVSFEFAPVERHAERSAQAQRLLHVAQAAMLSRLHHEATVEARLSGEHSSV
jgi:hypothetical protein